MRVNHDFYPEFHVHQNVYTLFSSAWIHPSYATDAEAVTTANSYIAALLAAVPLGPALPGGLSWNPDPDSTLFAISSPNTYGNFNTSDTRYIGLRWKFDPGDPDLFYGWVAVQVNQDNAVTRVLGYAYNDQAGQGLLTGETPEPSALALLAFGATGILALRRKRAA